ncbi:Hypothetical predicted protein [Mytilus galloprovincialis]|uniref:Mab-21-like HhH/H2TH-like domain-containing protein n=1 Tax=Mytilus galloprovincialis TaxID=29158 RepID=A0A8B6BJR8_MYTGA|nr:Hypothetical predicted protein [Mytilus galloprovincialis]
MTDIETKPISLALYRYMCHNIVGSENYVKNLRLMNAVRDDLYSDTDRTFITSGSFGEGLEMIGSDLDLMYVIKNMEVYEDIKTANNSNVQYVLMETDDVKPGFTQLLVPEQVYSQFLCQDFEEYNGKHYFSSAILKQKFMCNTDITVIHGPCISDKDGRYDLAFCLHCKTWISQASQWITRSNNSWPSYNVKQSILKHGVLFVPIGVKGSRKEDIEWRISFSVGEKFLINTFTHTQLMCYALLKILLKDVITTYTECEDLLCSYFLKTIIFWISEELPQSIWKPENLIPCFMRCFSRLIYSVEYSVCLHYFIPENNMFENKIEGRAREILLEKLCNLRIYRWRCILFSNQLSNFHKSMWMDQIEPHTLHTIEVVKTLHSKLLWLTNNMYISTKCNTSTKIIHQIVSRDNSAFKYFYTYFMSVLGLQYAQSALLNSTKKCNKHQYKQYKSRICTLLQNIYHDAVSGWLMLASFFYESKQYSKALHIIAYSISKCSPEKLQFFMDMSDIHYQTLKLKLFQNISIVQLWKIMLIDRMKFVHNSWLIPKELQMEVENRGYQIPSIVYGYFLKLLCHYQLNNARQCQDCLHTLQNVISENYFIENSEQYHTAYTILGIVFQLLGDNESARQAFMQSVEIEPDYSLNTSVKRLTLMNSL